MAQKTAWVIAYLLLGTEAWAFPGGHGGRDPLPVPQIGEVRQQNLDNLGRLKAGMTSEEVSAVMGEHKGLQTYYFSWKAEIISNPHRIENLPGKDKRSREVHYYFAYQKNNDRKITTDEYCPLIYRDGILEGWGWPYYEEAIGPAPFEP